MNHDKSQDGFDYDFWRLSRAFEVPCPRAIAGGLTLPGWEVAGASNPRSHQHGNPTTRATYLMHHWIVHEYYRLFEHT